jgi:adenylosuccinate lyase
VQHHALETWDRGGDFRERVLAEPGITAVLSKEEIERAFSLDEALRHVDAIFERTLAREGEES